MWHLSILVLVVQLVSSVAFSAVSDWPPEAQEYLNAIPGRKLTMEVVVGRALSTADVFQLHRTEAYQAEATYYNTVSAEDFRIKGSYFHIDNQNEPLIPQFMATATEGWEAKLGVEQFLPTGTLLGVEGTHTPQDIRFQTIPSIQAIESRLTFSLQQSLLGDFFGSGYRGLKRSASLGRQAIQENALSKIEGSTVDIISLFYQAWLKKESTLSLLEAKKRKDRLVKIYRPQERRGVVEKSDLLQVEGTALATDVDYINTKRDLQNVWEQLVINLKLPRSFLKVDPVEIPITLDNPEPKALELCGTISFTDLEKNSLQLRAAASQLESAEEKYKAMKQKLMPDLKLQASYSLNSIDSNSIGGIAPEARRTWSEVGNFENPNLTAGVTLSFPLQNRAQKAQYLLARMDYEQAQLRKSLLAGDLEAQWSLLCQSLKQKVSARDSYKLISSKNQQRVNLDNRRFEVGRIKSFQWLLTEDEEANTTLRYQQAEVDVRITAWDIQRQAGHLTDLILKNLPAAAPEAL